MERSLPARMRWAGAIGAAVVVLALSALALAGCGGSEDSAQAGGAQNQAQPGGGDFEAFAQCLRENGADLQPGGGGDPSAFQAAQEACADLAPGGGGFPPGGAGPGGPGPGGAGPGGGDPTALIECLRGEGIDIPEGDDRSALRGALDPNDPDVQEALEVCRSEFGPGAPGGGGVTTTEAPVS